MAGDGDIGGAKQQCHDLDHEDQHRCQPQVLVSNNGCLVKENFKEEHVGTGLITCASAGGELLPHRASSLAEVTYDFL